jgi:hypothetical protein
VVNERPLELRENRGGNRVTFPAGVFTLRKASTLPSAAVLLIWFCVFLAALEGYLTVRLVVELGAHLIANQFQGHNDFVAFYSAARFMLHGQAAQLYNSAAIASFQHTLVSHDIGAKGYMPFLNPPFAAVLQAPLALLPEPIARTVWFGANVLLAIPIVRWLTGAIPARWRMPAAALLLGTFPIYQTLVEGQWSLILLLGCLAALQFARRGWYVGSGVGLSVLWLKPQLALIVLVGLLLFRCWRIVFGMTAALALFVALTLPITGLHSYVSYVPFLLRVFGDHFNGAGALHPTTWQGSLGWTEGANGLFSGWFGQSSVLLVDLLSIFSIGATLLLYLRAVRRVRPGFGSVSNELMLVASIVLVLLIDPHLYPQDLTLVLLAVPILFPHLKNPLPVLVAICCIIDAPFLDQFVPLHVFTLFLWCSLIFICLAIRTGEQRANEPNRAPHVLGATWLTRHLRSGIAAEPG